MEPYLQDFLALMVSFSDPRMKAEVGISDADREIIYDNSPSWKSQQWKQDIQMNSNNQKKYWHPMKNSGTTY
jgi:hypothetical protein